VLLGKGMDGCCTLLPGRLPQSHCDPAEWAALLQIVESESSRMGEGRHKGESASVAVAVAVAVVTSGCARKYLLSGRREREAAGGCARGQSSARARQYCILLPVGFAAPRRHR
jgi:hypothetical protein